MGSFEEQVQEVADPVNDTDMARSLVEILKKFDSNCPLSTEVMENVERQYGLELPTDYKLFMSSHDGGEGFIGEQYVILWRGSELIQFNREYEVEKYAPGLLLFGSNGGGEGFAFDMRPGENMRIRI